MGEETAIKYDELLLKLESYLQFTETKEDAPTIAGLSIWLGLSKADFLALRESKNKKVKNAVNKALCEIEHYYISKSALKKISSATAHFYLINMFGYKREIEEEEKQENINLKITVDGEE